MKFSEMPEDIRVKLSREAKEEFWKTIEEFGGIKEFSTSFNVSASKMYNWKNKDSYIPISVVKRVHGTESAKKITAYKGKSRSKPVQNPVIPLPKNNEFLTRINTSVILSKGTPTYQVNDKGLIERFINLLQNYGDVPYTVYNRNSVYELRYPKYMHELFEKIPYNKDFAALVDEKGNIKEGNLVYNDQKKPIENFEGELYSRDKALKLALERGNNRKVKNLMIKEAEKVEKAFNN